MKSSLNIWLFPVLFFLATSNSQAQIGIKGGFGVSDIVFADKGQTPYLGYEIDYMEHKNPLLSFQLGTSYTFKLNKRFYLQPELLLARQGLDYDISFLYDQITYQIRINYLQVPLLFYYRSAPEKKLHYGLFTGPYTSLKLKAVKEVEIENNLAVTDASNVKSSDFGIIGGFNIDIELPSGQLLFELRTSYGLVNMMELIEGYIPSYYGSDKERARNTSITILVGYRFQKANLKG